MGIFEDLARNPALVEMTGALGQTLLERRRKEDFDKATADYTTRLMALERQKDRYMSPESVAKMQNASAVYQAEAARISDEYAKRARELSEFNNRVFAQELQNAQAIARQRDFEMMRDRALQQEAVVSGILNDPDYAMYNRLRQTMTPRELQGEKGRVLEILQGRLMQKHDPARIAAPETAKLFQIEPQKEVARDLSGYFANKQKEDDMVRRIMFAFSSSPGGKGIKRSQAMEILEDTNNIEKIVRQLYPKLDETEVSNLATDISLKVFQDMNQIETNYVLEGMKRQAAMEQELLKQEQRAFEELADVLEKRTKSDEKKKAIIALIPNLVKPLVKNQSLSDEEIKNKIKRSMEEQFKMRGIEKLLQDLFGNDGNQELDRIILQAIRDERKSGR